MKTTKLTSETLAQLKADGLRLANSEEPGWCMRAVGVDGKIVSFRVTDV